MLGKFSAQIYGFVEADTIHDSTQSFQDLAGNGNIAKPGSYAGDHGRETFSVRNSRFGIRMTGPSTETIRTSAMLEMDFLGNQPNSPNGSNPSVSQGAFYGNPTFRIRHFNFKVETPVVDVLLGQYWQLFGWQSTFHPATVEIQGVPGQIYSRAVQARISKHVHSDPLDFEIAVAAARPPQQDSQTPDLHGGLKFTLNHWTGWHSNGAAGGAIDGLSLGVSGVYRDFNVQELSAKPAGSHSASGYGVSIDALLPIIPATAKDNSNALTINASFVSGVGIADLFTGLTGGVVTGTLTTATGTTAFTGDVDSGLVAYDANGMLHAIQWTSVLVGLQYHLPVAGLWVAANYSQMHSNNSTQFGGAAGPGGVFDQSRWYSGNLFWDASKAVRFGGEFAHFEQTYGDGVKAKNDRVQASAFYIF